MEGKFSARPEGNGRDFVICKFGSVSYGRVETVQDYYKGLIKQMGTAMDADNHDTQEEKWI